MALFEVSDLAVTIHTGSRARGRQIVPAVRAFDFSVDRGQTLAIVGESGSGKSASLLAATRLLGVKADVSGNVRFADQDLLALTPKALRRILGKDIGFVFQDPQSNLHPFKTVGRQIEEVFRVHRAATRRETRKRVENLLDEVGISDPAHAYRSHPAEFSGGMRQRVMIAIAIALNPALIIADEPTTALDVSVQAGIISLLRKLQHDHGTAIVFVSHDLGVVAEIARGLRR
jgi:peptide/nickel transport system ATP-binding protein